MDSTSKLPDPLERRVHDLKQLMLEKVDLIKQYEDEIFYSDDPRKKAGYNKILGELKQQFEEHRNEYTKLISFTNGLDIHGTTPFSMEWLDQLPFPIAIKCVTYNNADSAPARFLAVDNLLLNTIKYLAAIALSQYRYHLPDAPKIKEWLKRLSRHHLSEWVKLLQEIDQHYSNSERSEILTQIFNAYHAKCSEASAITQAFLEIAHQTKTQADEKDITVGKFIELLVTHRELTWETGIDHLNLKDYEMLLSLLQPALHEMINVFSILREYSLGFTDYARYQNQEWVYEIATWNGPEIHPKRDATVKMQGNITALPAKKRRLYLCDHNFQPKLNLHPLLIHHKDQLYFLESFGENEDLIFRPCHGGKILENPPGMINSLKSIYQPFQTHDEPSEIIDQIDESVAQMDDDTLSPELELKLIKQSLDDNATELLQTAISRTLSLEQNWIGMEFILIGMADQENSALIDVILSPLGIDPIEFQEQLFSIVGKSNKERRQEYSHEEVGLEILNRLSITNPSMLVQGDKEKLFLSPRLFSVLKQAIKASGAFELEGHLVSPDDILLAALQKENLRSVPINLLLQLILRNGQNPQKFIDKIIRRIIDNNNIHLNFDPFDILVNTELLKTESTQSAQHKNKTTIRMENSAKDMVDLLPKPNLSEEEKRNRSVVQTLFTSLQKHMAAQGVEVQMGESAWEIICSPFWKANRANLDPAGAFLILIETPLKEALTKGIYQPGDQVIVVRNFDLQMEFKVVKNNEQ